MQVPFGPLAPDRGAGTPGICLVANNVIPKAQGFGPRQQLVTAMTATALPSAPRGMITCLLRNGSTKVFGLTDTTLYQMSASFVWSSVATGYACTAGDDWSCAQFGDWLLYTNTTDGLWAFNIETNAAPTYIAAAGDPREIEIIANMVFAADCRDDAGARNNRLIRNSDFNDHTDWNGGAADQQPLETGGELRGLYNLRNGAAIVLQANAMRLLQFGNAGGGALYSLQEISFERGIVGRKSCVAFDGVLYGLSGDGFFRFTLGTGIETIGSQLIDEAFLARVPASDMPKVQGAIDPARKIVLWRYPSDSDPSGTVTNDLYGYRWDTPQNPWFTWSEPVAYLSRIATAGFTLEDLDAFGTVDSITIPWDDRFWQGGQKVFAALDPDLKFATFSGPNAVATIRSSTGNAPVTALIGWATPIDDCASASLSLGTADQLSDPIAWADPAAKVSAGRVPLRGRGMNIAFEWEAPASAAWTYVYGVDHIAASAGRRK